MNSQVLLFASQSIPCGIDALFIVGYLTECGAEHFFMCNSHLDRKKTLPQVDSPFVRQKSPFDGERAISKLKL